MKKAGTDSSFRNGTRAGTLISAGLLLLFLYHFWLYFLNTSVPPDEENFRINFFKVQKYLSESGIRGIFHIRPDLNYGALYWIASALTVSSDIRSSRVFNFVAMMGIASIYGLLKQPSAPRERRLIFLFWLSFPMAWWANKLNGPEAISTFLGFLGLLLSSPHLPPVAGSAATFAGVRPQRNWHQVVGPVLLGLAVGIKISNLAFVAGCICSYMVQARLPKHGIKIALIGFVLGFLLANPFAILQPQDIALLVPNPIMPSHAMAHIKYVLLGYYWEWDLVFSGGMAYLSMPLISWLMLLPHFRLNAIKLAQMAPFLVVIACNLFICFLNARFLGWYLFPAIVCLPLVLVGLLQGKLEQHAGFEKYLLAVLFLTALLNLQMVTSQVDVLRHNFLYVWPDGPRAYASSIIDTWWTQLANFFITGELS